MDNSVKIKIKSYGRAILYNKKGEVDRIIPINNLITTVGREWVIDLIGNNTSLFIDDMEFGSSDTAPTLLDTGVTTLLITKTANATSDLPNFRVEIRASLDAGDIVGSTIKEIALLLDNGDCFNHATFAAFSKTAVIVIFEWRIDIITT